MKKWSYDNMQHRRVFEWQHICRREKTTINTNEEVENGTMKLDMKKAYLITATSYQQSRLLYQTCYLLNYKIKGFPYHISMKSNLLWGETLKGYTSKLEIYFVR